MSVLVEIADHVRGEAYSISEQRWNGWVVPSFTKEQVEAMLPTVNAYALETVEASSFRFEGDRLIETRRLFDDPPIDEEGTYATEEEDVATFERDGVLLYGFGDSWVWELVDEVGLAPLHASDVRVPRSGHGAVWTEFETEDGTLTTIVAAVLPDGRTRLDVYGGLETPDSDPTWTRTLDVPADAWRALIGVQP